MAGDWSTGGIVFSSLLPPAKAIIGFIWGVGAAIQVPTITSMTLDSNVWGGRPTGVMVYLKRPIVDGVFANNI